MATSPLTNGLKFGIFLPPISPWPALQERARLVEQLGFESLWMGDKFAAPGVPYAPWFECWALLAGFACSTTHIRLGSLVTSIIYRNPALIAKQALTLDHISGGRFTLGLGASSAGDPDHTMTGVPAWPNAERVSRFEEVVSLVDQLLCHPTTTFEGVYYQAKDAIMLPPPLQQPRPPLLIAAEGPRMLKITARYADNWNALGGFRPSPQEVLERTRDNNSRITELASSLGRDPTSITRSFCVGWTRDQPFVSHTAFQEFIGRYAEAGIQQFMLGFWLEEEEKPVTVPMCHISSFDMLERIAVQDIPGL